ncbi:DUF6009 family protein [Streptomyces sp. NPDC052109]|uniref:DUF6009 family protein n=1 Tax=Streptomyces sp. NPDC052109 TaxID=3155527 RepID=UPI0034262191
MPEHAGVDMRIRRNRPDRRHRAWRNVTVADPMTGPAPAAPAGTVRTRRRLGSRIGYALLAPTARASRPSGTFRRRAFRVCPWHRTHGERAFGRLIRGIPPALAALDSGRGGVGAAGFGGPVSTRVERDLHPGIQRSPHDVDTGRP